jgi:hypothetical protein
MLPGVGAGGVSQGTEVHTGGPVRQEEAWLRAGQAVGGPGTKTLLRSYRKSLINIIHEKTTLSEVFTRSAIFSTTGVFYLWAGLLE